MKGDGCDIRLNYPPSARNEPRWGHGGRPPHPGLTRILEARRDDYQALLAMFLEYADGYRKIPLEEDTSSPEEPHLQVVWLPGLDSLALYCLLAINKPRHYIEIGSGNSTKFARRSIRDHGLTTLITSIDPHPRAEVDAICDRVIRKPVELVDPAVFDDLGSGDILFIDSSHRCFMNSDVTAIFLDVIPRLEPGVFVEVHDIFFPRDYPPHWVDRYYSEQYLLAAYLLAEGRRMRVLLPNAYISGDEELRRVIRPAFEGLEGVRRGGGSFWLTIGA